MLSTPQGKIWFFRSVSWMILLMSGSVVGSGERGQTIEMVPQVGHGSKIQHVVLSLDGALAISTSEDMTAKLWQVETGQLLRTLQGHQGMVTSAVFMPDGRRAATTSFDKTIRLWNLETGALVRTFLGHGHIVWWVAISSDGKRLLSAGYDNTVRLWNVETGRVIHVFQNVLDHRWVTFSPDGRQGLSIGGSRMEVHDLEVRKSRLLEFNGENVRYATFSPDSSQVLSGGGDDVLRLWDVESGSLVQEFRGHNSAVLWAGFQRDGGIASGDFDGEIISWDLQSAQPRYRRKVTDGSSVWSYSKDGSQALGWSSVDFAVWEADGPGRARRFSGYRQQIGSLAVGGNRIVALTDEDELSVWNLETGARELGFTASEPHVIAVGESNLSVSGTADRALTGHYGRIRLWDLDTGTLIREIAYDGMTKSVALSRDGKLALSGGYSMPLSLWNLETGQRLRDFKGHSETVTTLAFSPNGRLVLSGSKDLTAKVWDVETAGLRHGFQAKSHVAGIAVSPDSQRALILSENELQVVDVTTGQVLRQLTGHARPGMVAWAPDGRRAIATGGSLMGSEEDSARIWDTDTGELLWEGHGHLGTVHSGAFTPDSRHVVTGAADGSVRIWRPGSDESLVMIARGSEWLIYGRDGLFDASRQGGQLVAAVQDLSSFRVDQLATRLNRPDLLLERMGLGKPELRAHYRARYRRRLAKLDLSPDQVETGLEAAPQARILKLSVEDNRARLELEFSDSASDVVRYSLFVNDVPVFGPLGKPIQGKRDRVVEEIELSSGRNEIEVSALNASGLESLRDFRIVQHDRSPEGDLFFLGFGVSKYRDQRFNLDFAHKDALDLAGFFRATDKHYAKVHVRTFTDSEVTAAAIRDAKSLLKESRVDDTVVVFIAGHGTYTRDEMADYYYLTHDFEVDRVRETAASFELIEDLFHGIGARRRLLLIDTCESGEREESDQTQMLAQAQARGLRARNVRGVAVAATIRVSPRPFVFERERYIYNDVTRRTGAIVFSSSQGSELSYEDPEFENGVFTEMILQALTSDKADTDEDGKLTSDELRKYVGPAVAERTNGLQHPTVDRDNVDVNLLLPILKDL